MLLYADSTAGISHNPLRRLLGLSHGAAHRLADGLRTHMALSLNERPLGGWGHLVYIDECSIWFGLQHQHAMLLGLSDGERCALRVIPNRKATTLLPLIAQLVVPGSIIVTDGFASYRGLNRLGYTHSKVNHSRKMWVNEGGNGTHHVEALWRIAKRCLEGRRHLASEANLWKFVGEIMFRYNARKDRTTAWWQLIGAFPRIDDDVLEQTRRRIDVRYRMKAEAEDV